MMGGGAGSHWGSERSPQAREEGEQQREWGHPPPRTQPC